ncbi:MAG: hypothetical protein ABIB97_05720 [Patescibacteria group bacterium]
MKKKLAYSLSVAGVSLLTCVGIVYAASFTGEGTVPFDSIRIGQQGVGGVTFFNGTIVNETTAEGDIDNPVTFGDNVRIDGRVFRGAAAGTDDEMPFIVNDNMEVTGSLTIGSLLGDGIIATANLATDAVTSAKIADGAVDTDELAIGAVSGIKIEDGAISVGKLGSNAVTSAKILDGTVDTDDLADNAITDIQGAGVGIGETTTSTSYEVMGEGEFTMTTGNSNVLIMFSGTFKNNQNGGYTDIGLKIDGDSYGDYARRGTSGTADESFSLAFFGTTQVLEGDHTFQAVWRTSTGSTSTVSNSDFEVIELKK